jgi:hypothetical protein
MLDARKIAASVASDAIRCAGGVQQGDEPVRVPVDHLAAFRREVERG